MSPPVRKFKQDTADDARLEGLKKVFSFIPEGKALIDLAAQKGYAFRFDYGLPATTYGQLDRKEKAIYLNPKQNDIPLLMTMAHELRHLWQSHIVNFSSFSILAPDQALVFIRTIEGDAFSFAMRFMEKLQEKTGITIPRYVFMKDSPSKQTDMKEVFLKFQDTTIANGYDQRMMGRLKSLQDKINQGKGSKAALTRIYNRASKPPPSDANLTKITLNNLDPGELKYVDYKSVEELTNAILTHVPPETLRKAQTLVAKIKRSAIVSARKKI